MAPLNQDLLSKISSLSTNKDPINELKSVDGMFSSVYPSVSPLVSCMISQVVVLLQAKNDIILDQATKIDQLGTKISQMDAEVTKLELKMKKKSDHIIKEIKGNF